MPHQCLKCGAVYEEGTAEILRGCPKCGGNRFFFTKQPLTDEKLNDLRVKSNDDLRTMIQTMFMRNKDLLADERISSGTPDDWVKINSEGRIEGLAQLGKKSECEGQGSRPSVESASTESCSAAEPPSAEREETKTAAQEKAIEVVNVLEPGNYEINVEMLLDNSPIIIQNDGVYMVHLHSVFSSFKRGAKKP